MRQKLNRLISILMIFFLSANTVILISLIPNNKESTLKIESSPIYVNTNSNGSPFVVGVALSPYTIDPVDAWDTASYDVIYQVCEGLFQYNLSDPAMPRVNQLAESYFWVNPTTLDIKLREGIVFHDMYPFDSNAAVWNFNRLLYLTNCTGTLPSTQILAGPSSLYYFPDTTTPIINSVITEGNYNITIFLNDVYAPLLDLLCFTASYMVSPYSTPADDYVDLYTGDLVGTGPFVYDGYTPDTEINFYAFENYWQGKAAINEMDFLFISDSTARNYAMLNHTIDYLLRPMDTLIPIFEADPSITVMKFTEEYGIPSLVYQYLGMNNELINLTWRKAISHAINYTYIIEELQNNAVVRANSPISPGFGTAYNTSTTAADYDLAIARQTLVDAGIAIGYPVNSDPNDLYWLTHPLISLNYTYNIGNSFREDIYDVLNFWLPTIGIQVLDDGGSWYDYLMKLFVFPEKLGLFWMSWVPDLLDPYSMLDPLFNPSSFTNSAQVNDDWLNLQMASALSTINDDSRNDIYKKIQWYLAERLYPHCFGYHPKLTVVHSAELKGVPYNAREYFYAYPIYRQLPPKPFSLTSDAEIPDNDGSFILSWTTSEGADNYSVYQYSRFITEINGSLTLLANEITDLNLTLNNYSDGIYYFIVVAHNIYGTTLSNCISITVSLPFEHDLEVSLDVPSITDIEITYIITATVKNNGLNDETDVELLLYLEEIVVDSISIPYLLVGDSAAIQYEWTPTEYNVYIFEAYAPPIPGEIDESNNLDTKTVYLVETQIFDGLYISHIFISMGYESMSNFLYTPYQDGLFNEIWTLEEFGTYDWVVDPLTRLMSEGSIFLDGCHTPVWISTNTSLGDIIPIGVDGEGDHFFQVINEMVYDLPGFGPIAIWELEDLTLPGGIAWYEKSTGILLNGTFIYYGGMYNYTFEFVDTNAPFEYVLVPEPFNLWTDAETPDDDGTFTLFWTESVWADSYSVYQHSSFITEITQDLILIADGITELSLPLEDYTDGTYYFIVVAYNEYGEILSNCIQVDVDIKVPPTIFYDTVPNEINMTYTRSPQIIGSFGAYASSRIIYVGWVGPVDSGFSLSTTYNEDENGDMYLSETTIMTTNMLESGIHTLHIRIWDVDGDFCDKIFTVEVYRQAELTLSGEFDYLEKEDVKISIIAQVIDIEDQSILNPINLIGMIVHLRIVNSNGAIVVEDTMIYDSNGFFHWSSADTIKELKNLFTKGLYIVQGWVEFPSNSFYQGGTNIIQFHIDPPSETDFWFILGTIGFSGTTFVSIALFLRERRRRKELKR